MTVEDTSWDFKGNNTKEFTHCYHLYPAMMIPQIARRLIDTFGIENGRLLDPYCGTGTSLVEGSIYGMHGVGCDINPLVRLIAKTKTNPPSLTELDKTLNNFGELEPSNDIPAVLNMDYWFTHEVTEALASLRSRILQIEDNATKDFLWVAFSETVRECSNTRNGEFKLFRMPAHKLTNHHPHVLRIFQTKLSRNRAGLRDYLVRRKDVTVTVTGANTSASEKPQTKHNFDMVITSPPYGDSATTVAYGQFSRLAADWIGCFSDTQKIDKRAMGGVKKRETLPKSLVTESVERVRIADWNRAKEVESFYIDLGNSIETVASMMADNAVVCYVVGNRRVKGVVLPTSDFIVHEWEKHGFVHDTTIVRNIPNKRMPSRNSPSNTPGATASTMTKEYIVVCRKQR